MFDDQDIQNWIEFELFNDLMNLGHPECQKCECFMDDVGDFFQCRYCLALVEKENT